MGLGDVTFFREESNKEPVCDVKAGGEKVERTPRGGSAAFQLYQPDFHGDKAGSLFLS